jgi:hypothetical protein
MPANLRRAFTLCLIVSTSCRTDLGHRWCGSALVFRAAGFCGKMAVVVIIASPKIVCRSKAISRMAIFASRWFKGEVHCPRVSVSDKVSSSVRTMTDARVVTEAESTSTLERHVSRACSGTRNLNVWTRGGRGGGGAVSPSVRTGILMCPRTPLWSKKEVARVVVSPTWAVRRPKFQIVR